MNKKQNFQTSIIILVFAILFFIGFSLSNMSIFDRAQQVKERTTERNRPLNPNSSSTSNYDNERLRSFIKDELDKINENRAFDTQDIEELLSQYEDYDNFEEIERIIREEMEKYDFQEKEGYWDWSNQTSDIGEDVQRFNTDESIAVNFTGPTSSGINYQVQFVYTDTDGLGFEIYNTGSAIPRIIYTADPIMIRIQVNQGQIYHFRGIATNNGTRIYAVKDRVPMLNNILSTGGNINFRLSFGVDANANNYSFELQNADAFTDILM